MRTRRLGWLAALAALPIVATVFSGGVPAASAAPAAEVHLTVAGDVDSTKNSAAVLDAVAAQGPDANVFVGDLGYSPKESAWCSFVNKRLGKIPSLLVSGNHELFKNNSGGSLADYLACLPQHSYAVTGNYGREYYVDMPAESPLVRLVLLSPGLKFGSQLWSYSEGDQHYLWAAKTIDDARAAGIPWVVVGAHKPCLSMGRYGCEMGSDLLNLLMTKDVDLVANGHEHLYERTNQLRSGTADCPVLKPGSYDPACVADTDADLVQGRGTVFTVVGTAGKKLRTGDLRPRDPEARYFAHTTDTTYGYLDLRVTAASLTARFVEPSGSVEDEFTITRPVAKTPSPSAKPVTTIEAAPRFDSRWRLRYT